MMHKVLSRLVAVPLQYILRVCCARQAVLGIEDERERVVERCIKILRLWGECPE